MTWLYRYLNEFFNYASSGIVMCVFALIGFIWLVTNSELSVHIPGVVLFIIATSGYIIIFYILTRITLMYDIKTHNLVLLGIGIITFIFTFTFLVCWAMHYSEVYVLEHLTYGFYLILHTVFFYYHSPDPMGPIRDTEGRYIEVQIPVVRMVPSSDPVDVDT